MNNNFATKSDLKEFEMKLTSGLAGVEKAM